MSCEHAAQRPCRLCGEALRQTFVDLGESPLANALLEEEDLDREEPRFPLHVYVCSRCFLVQLEEFAAPETIFVDYAYFSSYADTWRRHCAAFATQAIDRLELGARSRVIEVASNDGCLLREFRQRGIPVLGVEPAGNVAEAAVAAGVPTITEFFGAACAGRLAEDGTADLLVANNVLAHVPDLHDFIEGMRILLSPAGVITVEFPHLLRLIEQCQFDTIYHEHFSYFSFAAAARAFEAHGLTVFDVERIPVHGGSLRLYVRHQGTAQPAVTDRVAGLREQETNAGLDRIETYAGFEERVRDIRRRLLGLLCARHDSGGRLAAYGAPAKGNTLLNYCGIGPDLIEYTVDRNPRKQGRRLPGSRLPVYAPEAIRERKPDGILILPWNLKDEIMEQVGYVREWGARFVVPIPEPEVLP